MARVSSDVLLSHEPVPCAQDIARAHIGADTKELVIEFFPRTRALGVLLVVAGMASKGVVWATVGCVGSFASIFDKEGNGLNVPDGTIGCHVPKSIEQREKRQ